MSPTCAERQIAFWKGVDGELGPEESKALVEHLRACEPCRSAVRQASRTHRILLETAVDAPLRISTRRARRSWQVSALAAAGVLIGLGILFVVLSWTSPKRGLEESDPSGAQLPKPTPVDVEKAPDRVPPEPPPPPPPAPDPVPKPTPEKDKPSSDPPPPPPKPALPVPKPVEPEPTKRPPEPPRKTEVTVARLEKVEGEAHLVTGPQRALAQTGAGLVEGQGLAVGAKGAAWVLYGDKTRVKLGPDTEVLERGGPGKRLEVLRGTVSAEVPKQPVGQPMVFATAHGEAMVLGTTLRLVVDAEKTRLEVTDGKVRLSRADGKSVDIVGGHFGELTAKSMPREGRVHLAEDFEDARRAGARWTLQEDSFPVSFSGRAVFDLSPRGKDPQGTGVNWTVASGGLQTREALRVPFRVSLEMDATASGRMFPWIRLLPAPLKKNSKRMLSIERRPPHFDFRVVDEQGKTDLTNFAKTSAGTLRRERWRVEVHAAEIAVWVDGEERDRLKHGLTLAPAYFLALGASAQQDVPKDAKVEFDDVVLELLKE